MKIFGVHIGKSPKPPTDPTEPTRAVLTPMGTSVSRAFTVASGEQGDAIRHTLAVIDHLHGDGIIPPLVARREAMQEREGQFRKGEGVFIRTQTPIAEWVTAHEIAHVLDFYGFTSGRAESLDGQEMLVVFDAYRSSTAYRALQTLRAQLSTPLTESTRELLRQKDIEQVNYLLKQDEVWARIYSQWVATFSRDPILLSQMEALGLDRQYARFFVQWSEPDFARIGREVELLFKRKGWLR